ncbi:MAG: hydroxymethylglutaryl-CoA lyase [Chitinophagaceae bacterium]|nr:hydroxymethylglutaryl-CoA lyase [Chitinophagaceae bacterium]
MNAIQLIECPRDAMQGWKNWIPTEKKIDYLNTLLQVGFDVLDFGSFVSAKAIPQLADTKQVLAGLNMTSTKLLAIIANTRGAEEAVQFDEISYLGFPFSISETFQKLNTNSTIQESLLRVEEIQNLCIRHGKKLVIYISMGFGNPYGDLYNAEVATSWVRQLHALDIEIFALSDTVGLSSPNNITPLFTSLISEYPRLQFGAHFHSTPDTASEKIQAALDAGCKRFDAAIGGIGGCPMAQDELVGNLATERLLDVLTTNNLAPRFNVQAFDEARAMVPSVFI